MISFCDCMNISVLLELLYRNIGIKADIVKGEQMPLTIADTSVFFWVEAEKASAAREKTAEIINILKSKNYV